MLFGSPDNGDVILKKIYCRFFAFLDYINKRAGFFVGWNFDQIIALKLAADTGI